MQNNKISSRRSSGSRSRFVKSSRRANSSRGGSRPYGNKRHGNKRKGTEQVDIAEFIRQAASSPKPKQHIIKHSFADFGLIAKLQQNLLLLKFTVPTPIQDQAIPHILAGTDVVGLANTGTGKTGAFLLPLINKIERDWSQRALIITPTRELAMQIYSELQKFSRATNITSAVCIGGVPIFRDLKSIKRNPRIVIGTPGRLEDLNKRGVLDFSVFNSIVLDEVDRMLDMGFIGSIRNILSQTHKQRQSLFFSATVPPAINLLIKEFTSAPVFIQVSEGKTAHNVRQDVIRTSSQAMKFEKLIELLTRSEVKKVLIFSERKYEVEKLSQNLYRKGFRVDSIHGDKRQRQRDKSLINFRNNRINILVATDVAARGLDIKEVTHVINYTVPQTYNDYIHRIGRTGRGANKGVALTFV